MVAVVRRRPKLARYGRELEEISALADSCVRQLNGWSMSVLDGSVQGNRRPGKQALAAKRAVEAAKEFRVNWLKTLKPEHPLFSSPEAKEARGEPVE